MQRGVVEGRGRLVGRELVGHVLEGRQGLEQAFRDVIHHRPLPRRRPPEIYHRCAARVGPVQAGSAASGCDGEARVVDLTGALGLAQSTVSKHLACLRGCRLVDFRAEGRQSFYFVARPELLDLLRSAEGLLAATGEAVALCPAYGTGATGVDAAP
ncbi:MAG TPA: metalloregulator ArsR/SmtB family transcription factor [Acidimicrobiales bacterium]